MEGFAGMFRGLLAVPQTEAEKQLLLLRGLFSGMPPAEYASFTENLESRSLEQQRVVVPALREAMEDARLNAQRRGVRDCDNPTQADLSNPAWSEFNIARDAYKRGVALVPLQDRALKAIQELARRGEEFRQAGTSKPLSATRRPSLRVELEAGEDHVIQAIPDEALTPSEGRHSLRGKANRKRDQVLEPEPIEAGRGAKRPRRASVSSPSDQLNARLGLGR